MPSDAAIVIADQVRLGAIRHGLPLPGRVMHFTSTSAGSAIASIRAYRPKVIAIDAIFAATPAGTALIDQIEGSNLEGSGVLLIVEDQGRWVTMPRRAGRIVNPPQDAVVAQALAALSSAARPAPRVDVPSSRRAPRFLVRAPISVGVESGEANLVNMSILGAQIVSQPVLRPRQKIKLGLPDADEVLSLEAEVAWSMFERPQPQVEPHYRVGIQFAGGSQAELEEYCRQHCLEAPGR